MLKRSDRTDLNICRRQFLGGMVCSTGTFVLCRLLDGSVAEASTLETPEKTGQTGQASESGELHPMINAVRNFRLPFGTEPAIVYRPRRYEISTEGTDR